MNKIFKIEYLIYLILLSLPLYLVRFNIFHIPMTVLEVEIYILAVIFLASSLKQKKLHNYLLSFLKNPFFLSWVIFFIAGIISVFISPEKMVALGIFKAYFFDSSLFFLIFISVIKTKEEVKNSFVALITSAILLSLIGLAQYLLLPQFLQDGRIRSIFSTPNYLSLYTTPISFLVFGIFKIFKKKNLCRNLFFISTYLIIFLAITLTFSRGAWLGLTFGLIFFVGMMILKKSKKPILKLAFASLFLIGFIASFFFIIKGSYSFGLVPQSRVYSSDNIRKEIWSTSLDIGLHHSILGTGLGNFQKYFGEYTKNRINYPEYITPNALTPHNIFLNIWLQTGILGLLGLLGLLGIFVWKCFSGFKKEFILNVILMASMISILGQGLVDSAVWKNDLMIVFWFLLGASYIINSGENKNER